jgi:hypothetical protein
VGAIALDETGKSGTKIVYDASRCWFGKSSSSSDVTLAWMIVVMVHCSAGVCVYSIVDSRRHPYSNIVITI